MKMDRGRWFSIHAKGIGICLLISLAAFVLGVGLTGVDNGLTVALLKHLYTIVTHLLL